MTIASSVTASNSEEERILEAYQSENRQLAAKRFPYVWGLFIVANGIGSYLEQLYFPERGVNVVTGSVWYAFGGVVMWLVIRLRPRATLVAFGVAENFVIATVCTYYAQFHASAHLLTFNLMLLLAGFAAFVPCNLRGYLLSCGWIFIGYPGALGVFPVFPVVQVGAAGLLPFAPLANGVISVTPLSYDILSLSSAIITFSIGA